MPLTALADTLKRRSADLPIWQGQVDAAQWTESAARLAQAGGRLVSLWGSDRRASAGSFAVYAAYATANGLFCLELPVAAPTLSWATS